MNPEVGLQYISYGIQVADFDGDGRVSIDLCDKFAQRLAREDEISFVPSRSTPKLGLWKLVDVQPSASAYCCLHATDFCDVNSASPDGELRTKCPMNCFRDDP